MHNHDVHAAIAVLQRWFAALPAIVVQGPTPIKVWATHCTLRTLFQSNTGITIKIILHRPGLSDQHCLFNAHTPTLLSGFYTPIKTPQALRLSDPTARFLAFNTQETFEAVWDRSVYSPSLPTMPLQMTLRVGMDAGVWWSHRFKPFPSIGVVGQHFTELQETRFSTAWAQHVSQHPEVLEVLSHQLSQLVPKTGSLWVPDRVDGHSAHQALAHQHQLATLARLRQMLPDGLKNPTTPTPEQGLAVVRTPSSWLWMVYFYSKPHILFDHSVSETVELLLVTPNLHP